MAGSGLASTPCSKPSLLMAIADDAIEEGVSFHWL
jgi:hypothetical protein